jgi:glycosyltransferase involved in cell wall biosynthesis
MKHLRIAAFGGFRAIPPKEGGAGSDKFAFELYPRISKLGHELIAYARIYPGDRSTSKYSEYEGIKIISFHTVNKAGFDTLIHSCKATFDIIIRNRADVIHIHSGANSIWAIVLRLFGKRVFVSQFAMDWKRDKWPWYGKLFYKFSNYLTAFIPNGVAFDNIFTKEYFEKKFHRQFYFIPYGSEVKEPPLLSSILERLGVSSGQYFLFVGRFIPDKGVHLLIRAFLSVKTDMKLVLVGGAPNPNEYEKEILSTKDDRIIFAGYVYGDETNFLIKNAFTYVQPSLIEGLSPVILTVMGLETPLICSDIVENKYITRENATHFISGNVDSLTEKIKYSLNNIEKLKIMAKIGKDDILNRFKWESITNQYIELFYNKSKI